MPVRATAESKSVLQLFQMAFYVVLDRYKIRHTPSDGKNDMYIGSERTLAQRFCKPVPVEAVGLTHQSLAFVAVRGITRFLPGNKAGLHLLCTILYNEKTGINNGARKAFPITEYPVKYTCAPENTASGKRVAAVVRIIWTISHRSQ